MASPYRTGLPVSSRWLPPHRVALLNAIAGGESGGRYNVRYTPKGGAEFKSFDRHPGIFEPGPHGKSSAAGRYQFTKTTWDDLGGGEFTPERQDEMAWRLAERDYRKRTGSDLDADLQAKGLDPEIIEALAPTWKALESNKPRHQATFQQTLGEILGGDAAVTPTGSAGSDTVEDSMATGGFSSLGRPLQKPVNRSKYLAMILEDMQKDRPNPQSWAETGLRVLGQGVRGYFAGKTMREDEAEEQRQREVLAGILEGNPQAAALLQSGVGDMGSWENAILQQAFKEPEKPEAFTLSPGQARFRGDQEIASIPDRPEKPSARDRQARMLMETGLPEDIAMGIAAGRFTVSRDPVSGVAQVVDLSNGQPVGGVSDSQAEAVAEAAPADQQAPQTLWDSTGGVAGVYGAAEELYGNVAGQTGLEIGEEVKETTRNRQMFRTAQNDLIRSLSINPRFPVAEMNRIKEEVQIEPAIMDSEQSLKERMKSVDRSMRRRLENERRAAKDGSLPVETRRAAAQAAKDIENFLGIMGVPQEDEKDRANRRDTGISPADRALINKYLGGQ